MELVITAAEISLNIYKTKSKVLKISIFSIGHILGSVTDKQGSKVACAETRISKAAAFLKL